MITSYMAIDPGLKGGVAWWANGVMSAEPLEYAGRYPHMDVSSYFETVVAVEQQHGRPQDGVKSLNSLLPAFGYMVGWLNAKDIPCIIVPPTEWKRAILRGTARDKQAAIDYVRNKYPDIDLTPGRLRKPHDGIADAVCICEWLLRRYQQQP